MSEEVMTKEFMDAAGLSEKAQQIIKGKSRSFQELLKHSIEAAKKMTPEEIQENRKVITEYMAQIKRLGLKAAFISGCGMKELNIFLAGLTPDDVK